jgi:DNA excision repair protein ERCC-2
LPPPSFTRSPSDALYWFPHAEAREPQREFLTKAKAAYAERKHVLAHLPTGIGKTAVSLAAALATDAPKILYLTNRQTQHAIVVRELDSLLARGVPASYVDLISKQSMCCNEDALFDQRNGKRRERSYPEFLDECLDLLEPVRKNPDAESRCRWFNRARTAEDPPSMAATKLVPVARDHGLCPYYWALKRFQTSRVIIGDYNLLIIPGLLEITLERAGVPLEDCVVIFDEAHNLPDRVCDHHSRTMTAERISAAARDCLIVQDLASNRFLMEAETKFRKATRQGQIPEKERLVGSYELTPSAALRQPDGSTEKLDVALARLSASAEKVKSKTGMFTQLKPVSEFFSQWYQEWPQIRIAQNPSPGDKPPHAKIELAVIDPKPFLAPLWNRVRWSILMSGTLHPTDCFATHIGMESGKVAHISAASPFPKENRKIQYEDSLSTKFSERSDQLYPDFATQIRRSALPNGNIAVFVPSYAFAARMAPHLKGIRSHIIEERSAMDSADRERVLDHLRKTKEQGTLLLGVFRGGFCEGVDFPGGLLPQVYLVGLPLTWDLKMKATVDHYKRTYGAELGEDLSLNIPAVRQAVQAAGRGVRGPTDKCSIHFLDRRYNERKYGRLLPDEYRPVQAIARLNS